MDAAPSRRPFPLAALNRWVLAVMLAGLALLYWFYGQEDSEVAFQSVPTHGGVYREGVRGTPLYINPVICTFNEIDRTLCRLLFRGLMRFDSRGVPETDLAESYEISADGLVYTFRLRRDQRWHDDTRLTAYDAEFTFRTLQHEDFPGETALASAARLARVEAVDELTLTFTLEQPFAPFIDLTTIGLLPRHVFGGVPVAALRERTRFLDIVGNGPFRVDRRGLDSIRLIPFFTPEMPAPFIYALEFRFFPQTVDLLSAFVANEIEGISTGIAGNLEALPNRDELQLFFSEESDLVILLFNHQSESAPELGERQVREALIQGVDRARVLADSPQAWGVVAHSPVPARNWAHHPHMPQVDFDALEAVRRLTDSGWLDLDDDGVRERGGRPFRLTLHTSEDALLSAYGASIVSYWRDLGIEAQSVSVPFQDLLFRHLEPGAFDAALIRVSDLVGDPDPFRFWHSSQVLNYGRWSNPYADGLMEQARITLDQEARRRIYHEFQEVFAADLPAMPLSYPVYAYGVHERVAKVQIGQLNDSSDRFRAVGEWAILTARVAVTEESDSFPR